MTKTHAEFLEELKKDFRRELQYNLLQNKQAFEYLTSVIDKIEQFQAEQKASDDLTTRGKWKNG